MTHVAYIEKNDSNPYKDQEVFSPVTILEAPPLIMYGLRVYKNTSDGLKCVGEAWSETIVKNKHFARRLTIPKDYDFSEAMNKVEAAFSEGNISEVRGLFATQPHMSSVPRKVPDMFEIKVGGSSVDKAFSYAKEHMGKEIRAFDVLKQGQVVDVSAVSKGKGFQGPVKRFRVHRLQHKSRKSKRAVACIGPWHPARVMWTVPRAGQMGFHQRVEYNKQIIKISEKGEEITPKGGFLNYGNVRNDYIMIKGSVPGPKKRLIRIRASIRGAIELETPEITYINLHSQQSK